MKRRIKSLWMAALLIAGCTAEQNTSDKAFTVFPEEGESLTGRIAGPLTRVGFDDIEGAFQWQDGDKIAVRLSAIRNSGNTVTYTAAYKEVAVSVDPNDPSLGHFHLLASGGQIRDGFAICPASFAVEDAATAADLALALPAEHMIQGSMADASPMPMVAVNDAAETDLVFRHVGALLRLTLQNVPPQTKQIAVRMGSRITGKFAVADAGTTTPSIATDGAEDEVRFSLEEALDAYTSNFVLNVPIPTGTYPHLRITAIDADGEPIHSYYDEVSRNFDTGRGRHVEAQLSNLTTPLCLEATEIASVVISNPLGLTIELSSDAVTWTPMNDASKEIWLGIGDKLYFRGNNARYATGSDHYTNIRCDGRCYLYGNIMSLTTSIGFDQARSLTASNAFRNLFSNADICAAAGQELLLPATDLRAASIYCYSGLFSGCAALDRAPRLEAMSLPQNAYSNMFANCTSLTEAPDLPATNLGSSCYQDMFSGCTALETVPERLPAETATRSCYNRMFKGCTSLTNAPALPATTLDESCYREMFHGCTSLTEAPALDAKILKYYCYSGMFQNCSSLEETPALDSKSPASSCYSYMFSGCSALTRVPKKLPATDLSGCTSCYHSMFSYCTSLVTPPELPAESLASSCYSYMFRGCTSLTSAPSLPAEQIEEQCYAYMFENCSSLTEAPPKLNATVLKTRCYESMFKGCTSLVSAPLLPAEDLVEYCYMNLFSRCSSLTSITALFLTTPNSYYLSDWVSGVANNSGCTFFRNSSATWDPDSYRGTDGIPSKWTVEPYIAEP